MTSCAYLCVKFYWGTDEVLMPGYTMTKEASFQSAYVASMEAMRYPCIRASSIIAEGISERQTHVFIKLTEGRGVSIMGPATVGCIKPGCLRISDTGGMLDNIEVSRVQSRIRRLRLQVRRRVQHVERLYSPQFRQRL